VAIQNEGTEAARWSAADYESAIRNGWYASVAEGDGALAGFLVARAQLGELEILNMAIRSQLRRHGAGSLLLREALEFGRRMGAKTAFLEVRESNSPAVAFYGAHGFDVAGRRKRYYSDPAEDALLLSRSLT
jgi:ribosomal-protein-alanine N-acetyltransferase